MAKPTGARRPELVSAAARPGTEVKPSTAQALHAPPTQLDRLIHDRTRLAIVSALAVTPTLSFTELKLALSIMKAPC